VTNMRVRHCPGCGKSPIRAKYLACYECWLLVPGVLRVRAVSWDKAVRVEAGFEVVAWLRDMRERRA